ncbi:serine/threonine-protein kinase HT1-like isoform X2 [Papaver somniferum]|uniref:serine/threonine-protein kinase HT1-like isoform X2 n=1 Tax=Papaver somniferum TaxID=3469 RepID=UPI000E6FF5EF|nr:serine/threonine-protein kinase HT1-like isoform X2 [Papaver somniferum]
MSKTEHPNVVKFYAVVPDGPQPKLTVLCEYMQHGCLRKYLAENPGYVTCLLVCFFFSVSLRREDMLTKCEIMLIRKLDKSDKVRIAMHAARGLAYLHAQNIIHFDVKCNNLLLYDNNPCKIGDLGMFNTNIRRTPEDLDLADWKQSFPWIAPERLDDSGSRASGRAADIFSFGIVLWEIWTEQVPYANMDISLEKFLDDLKNKELRPAIPECCDS